jgi:endo-1,4-beta-xylanase
LQANIDHMAAETGLPVYITEYDINLADDERQKSVMQDQFTMFWENPNIKGITLWGYVYGSTWMENTGLVRADGTLRPAMSWLVDYLGL